MTRERCPEIFARGEVFVRYSAEAVVRRERDAAPEAVRPDFGAWVEAEARFVRRARWRELTLTQTARAPEDDPEAVEVTLSVRNEGARPVYVDALTPVRVGRDDLRLGATDSRDWLLFRQGRHKNDLPGVCRLGAKDEAAADARVSLVESGGGTAASGDGEAIVSDSLTILRAGPDSAENLMIAFPGGDRFLMKTVLRLDGEKRFASLEASSEVGLRLDPGRELRSEPVELRRAADVFNAIDGFARRKAARFQARTALPIPSVYCTWYYYGLTVREQDVLENLEQLQARSVPFTVFQIDEGWERVLGDCRPNGKFPSGMAALADRIRAAGYAPGLWTSPLIAHATAPVAREHPDWFLRYPDGSPCLFPMNDTVYQVLDVTHPEVPGWLRALYKQLRAWGYNYHKLDFTRAAVIQRGCRWHDETVPPAAAYRAALRAVREGIGEDAYLLVCGGLYDPLIGIADAQRAGSDVLSIWSQSALQQKGGKVAPFTMKQNLLRYYLNHWWHSDPDALMVRRQKERTLGLNLTLGLLTDAEALTSALNQYIGGGLVCATEPMAEIDDDRLMLLRHILPPLPVRAVPRDLFAGGRYPSVVDVAVKDGAWHTVCLINWRDDIDMPVELRLDETLLGDFVRRHARFFAASPDGRLLREDLRAGDVLRLSPLPPHACAVVKIAPQGSLPAVVGTEAHFSMGAELEELSLGADGLLRFRCDWPFAWPARYDILLPSGRHATRLPEGVSAEGRMLHVFLAEKGRRAVDIPTAED